MNNTEKKVFWILAGILLLFTSIPYLAGFYSSGPDKHFAGYIENPRDALSYYMWMRQVYEGEYLLKNMFAPEPQPRIYFNPFFFMAGFLARLFIVPPHVFYWILRLPVSLLLLFTIYQFLLLIFKNAWERIWCYSLICFSSGLGWIFTIPKLIAGDFSPIHYPVDLYSPSAITFWTILSQPHVAFSQVLIFLYFICLMKFRERGELKWALTCGLILGFTAVNHTYDIVIMISVSIVYLIFLGIQKFQINLQRLLLFIVLIGVLGAIGLSYVFYVIHVNVTLRYWSEQSSSPYISPLWYLFGAGLLLPPAIIGLYRAIKLKAGQLYIPVIWLILLPVLLYCFFFQPAKLVNGSHVILCILAVSGLLTWVPIQGLKTRKRIMVILLSVAVTCPSNLIVYHNAMIRHVLYPKPLPSLDRFYFPETSIWKGFQWLNENTENDDVVMCSRLTGWMIPGFSGNRSLLGHRDFSMNLSQKIEDYHKYYVSASTNERLQILRKYNIRYIWVGPDEHYMMNKKFIPDKSLKKIYVFKDLTIYRVND